MKAIIAILISTLFLTACENKHAGFGLEDSSIRYQNKHFSDPNVLAEVNGIKFTRDQILDKSAVLKDLDRQESEGLTALAYMKIADSSQGKKPQGAIEVFLPESKTPLASILNRFDREPIPGLTVVYRKGGEEGVVAHYKDTDITREQLNTDHVVFQSIDQRRYREIATQLNSQMSRILVAEKAQAAKQDLQKFLQENVFHAGAVSISNTELMDYLKSIGFSEKELTDEMRGRFTEALKQHKEQKLIEDYAADEIIKGPVDVAFTEPTAHLKISDSWTPVMGYKDAPISLIAFSGSNCPDCSTFIEALRDVMKKYDGYLKLNWIHNFNDSDGVARMMAEAALCVDSVRKGKSVEFLDAFSKKADQIDERAFYNWADKHGVDSKQLKECIIAKRNDQLLAQHLEYAKKVGIVANPTLLIDGHTLQGVITEEKLNQIVKEDIERKGASPIKAFWRRIRGLFST